jgi:uncharacterized protein (TIGR02301 family)
MKHFPRGLAAFAPAPHNRPMNRLRLLLSGVALALALAGSALAQDAPAAAEPPAAGPEPPPPIYEEKLLRLSEILGALTFLRDLCGETDSAVWRNEMRALLAAEKPPPTRRTRLIARFNHGFETFNAVYRTCTPSAELSISRYLTEGAALANDVRSRYSQ